MRLDWPSMLRLWRGAGGSEEQFWQLTPFEFQSILAPAYLIGKPMTRANLAQLIEKVERE